MRPDTLQTRGLLFAFLFGPPKFVPRTLASSVYDAVSTRLSIEDFNFQYNSSAPESGSGTSSARGFGLQLVRQEGRGVFTVEMKNKDAAVDPHHLLLSATWPIAPEVTIRMFDDAAAAVFEALQESAQIVLAEARIRAHCAARGDDALAFLHNDMLRVPTEWLSSLGQPSSMTSMRFEVASAQGTDLENPRRSLTIEVLRDDPRSLYCEFVSTWPQLPDQPITGGVMNVSIGSIRRLQPTPSVYVKEAREFLENRLQDLAQRLEP